MLQEVAPSEQTAGADAKEQALHALLRRYLELAPKAFEAPANDVLACLAAIGRNFVSSQLPLGTLVASERDGVPAVSAGHESHPSTTHAATEEVFAFLKLGAAGNVQLAASNNVLRNM